MTNEDPFAACVEGRITPEVAVARLLLAGESIADLRRRVDELRCPKPEWSALRDLVQQNERLETLRHLVEVTSINHSEAASLASIAATFDRAVSISPEASVAFYSLGEEARLKGATDEVVKWLLQTGLLTPASDVLDIGCGIGRIAAATAPFVRWILGTEISIGMLRVAKVRCRTSDNVSLILSSGQGLTAISENTFDLALAVDCFPYFFQAGVVEQYFADIQRILRSGGSLAVLNFSYRGRPDLDRSNAELWSQRYGLSLRVCGDTPFSIWDAPVYVFRKEIC